MIQNEICETIFANLYNAMLAAATAILNLHAIPRHGHAENRINVGKVVAGDGRNIICDHAHLAGRSYCTAVFAVSG